jgi:hypothetical protein
MICVRADSAQDSLTVRGVFPDNRFAAIARGGGITTG